MTGVIALVGGGEWRPGCAFDAELLERSGGGDVLVLPTAAAYERPERAVATAVEWFAGLGGTAMGLPVLQRTDAMVQANADAVAGARFIYLAGGSPLHLRSVLKETPVWEALVGAWEAGAVVAGSSAGAMVLCDPMIDPRGGAFTVGLGLVTNLAVLAHARPDVLVSSKRTIELAGAGLVLAAIPEETALLRSPEGAWSTAGAGQVTVIVDHEEVGLDALPG